jgi:hypothetical protein
MIDVLVVRVRHLVERLIQFDRTERERRARRTERIRRHAVGTRIRSEKVLADPFRTELDGAVAAFRRRR